MQAAQTEFERCVEIFLRMLQLGVWGPTSPRIPAFAIIRNRKMPTLVLGCQRTFILAVNTQHSPSNGAGWAHGKQLGREIGRSCGIEHLT
jgi:hypothetical protein